MNPLGPVKDRWRDHLFYPLVIGAMVGCVAWSLAEMGYHYFALWRPAYLVTGCVLAALEANYSYRLLHEKRWLRSFRFRAAEWGMLFIAFKVGHYIGAGPDKLVADLQAWSRNPLLIFDDVETLFAFSVALFFWIAATQTTHDLNRLGEPPERTHGYVSPVKSLVQRFFWGGVILFISTGLTRIAFTELLRLDRPSTPGLILNVLVYFLLGLLLLGQVHLVRLYEGWRSQAVEIAPGLSRRWARYSLILIGLAAVLAFVLPTGYTMGLLQVMRALVDLAFQVGVLIFILLTFPFQLLIWALAALMGESSQPPPRLELPEFEPVPRTPLQESGGIALDWLGLLRALLFWGAILLVVCYVVRSYLRDRPELLRAVTQVAPARTLRRWWASLTRWFKRWRAQLGKVAWEHLPHGLPRQAPGRTLSRGRFRFFRLGALPARERVLYYYLSILRRAEQQGRPRQRHQTPYEYAETLTPHLPQDQGEMDALTQAFVEARYSAHPVALDQERRVRDIWRRVKAALRALNRREKRGR